MGLQERVTQLAARVRRGKPDPLSSVALTVPVFLLYHLGIVLIDKRNGVDWVSGLTLRLLDSSVMAYVGVTLALAGGLIGALWLLRRKGKVRAFQLMPIIAESTGWALLMLVTVGWVTQQVLSAGAALTPLEKLVMSAGAGFHEELVFRVLLISGGVRLLMRAGSMAAPRAWAIALIGSAVVFSLVHHVGALGEPFTLAAFVFRTFAGLFLSLVYVARGFAVAVYTHALYDVLIFFGLG